MGNPWDDLKGILSAELTNTLGALWNTRQDRDFLAYQADKCSKYIVRLKTATTDQERMEAQFNLDMLQVALGSYAAQKAMVAGQSAEEIAKKVFALLVGTLVKAIRL